jgi:hypothetical protein
MAPKVKTCSRKTNNGKTSVVCDHVSSYTFDLLTPVSLSNLQIIVVLHIISNNFVRLVFYIQNIVANPNLFFSITSATLVSFC